MGAKKRFQWRIEKQWGVDEDEQGGRLTQTEAWWCGGDVGDAKEEEGKEPLISLPLGGDGQETHSLEIHTSASALVPWSWSNDKLRRVRNL